MKKLKNLIIFHPYSGMGGADRSLARLINNLDEKKYKIHFISLSKPLIKRFIKKKIFYYRVKSKRTILSIFEVRNIVNKILDKKNKNIFISNQNFANIVSFFILFKLKRIKHILIERNSLNELDNSYNFLDYLKKKTIKFLVRTTYKYSDIVICISNDLRKEIKNFTKSKTFTIYNPSLDQSIYKNKSYKEKIKIPKNLILNIARLEKQKDQYTLIKAFKKLNNKKNFKLFIVGYGSQYHRLIEQIKKYKLENEIKIFTKFKNPNFIIKKAKLFILSSRYEGFGNVLIEAGKNRIPIISSNCPHGPNEILNNGKFGDLFQVRNSNHLSSKLQNFLDNPKKLKIKSDLFFKSLKRFDTKKIIKKYEHIFENI